MAMKSLKENPKQLWTVWRFQVILAFAHLLAAMQRLFAVAQGDKAVLLWAPRATLTEAGAWVLSRPKILIRQAARGYAGLSCDCQW
jgi:hypothetical protein